MSELDLFRSGPAASPTDNALTVAAVTGRARQLIESGFRMVWVKGEIANFKSYRSGHWYFSLRDATAQARCVMWRDDNRRLRVALEDGMQVFVETRPTVWEERGEFRLTVRHLIPTDADGLWELRLQKAREALAKDGLLDPARKRRVPEYPRQIAVVTSPDGAALHDIVTVLGRRWPAVMVHVIPTRVQGENADREVCRALELVNRLDDVDVAIVGRGGGGREDLWTFNAERVARAVAKVRVPVISAVGHETDVTLVDLVADLRAPTPSAAAEAAVPDRLRTLAYVDGLAERLGGALTARSRLGRERLARTGDRLHAVMQSRIERDAFRVKALAGRLDALSPLRVLDRGYAVARGPNGAVLKSVEQFAAGSSFRLTVRDGDIAAVVAEESGG